MCGFSLAFTLIEGQRLTSPEASTTSSVNGGYARQGRTSQAADARRRQVAKIGAFTKAAGQDAVMSPPSTECSPDQSRATIITRATRWNHGTSAGPTSVHVDTPKPARAGPPSPQRSRACLLTDRDAGARPTAGFRPEGPARKFRLTPAPSALSSFTLR